MVEEDRTKARHAAWRAPGRGACRAARLVLAGLLLLASAAAASARPAHWPDWLHPVATEPLAPVRAFKFSGDFDGKKESKDLSAIACATPAGWETRACLLVSDDVGFARQVTLEKRTLHLDRKVRLLAKDEHGAEADAEAATFLLHGDGHAYYYVTGSHGAARNDAAYQPTRFRVFRIAEDPGTGRLGEVEWTGALQAVIAQVADLAKVACTPAGGCAALDADGLTIEGLAAKGDALYFGLRAPVGADGRAYVLRVSADGLFAGRTEAPDVLRPRLGPAFGVRDLVAVRNGFLILAGLDVTKPAGQPALSIVYFWDGTGEETRPLAVLATADVDAQPEALLVLEDRPDQGGFRLLVISDGVKKGAPSEYVVPRP